jgi:HNH endonuclease
MFAEDPAIFSTLKSCLVCGEKFPFTTKKPHQKFCSPACALRFRGTLPERLESKFTADSNSRCWLWQACCDRSGYGIIKADGKARKAHAVIYELCVGPVPEGMELDHLCHNPQCVNPDHLDPAPKRINILRGMGVGAKNCRKTHCSKGHPLSGDNLRIRSDGYSRVCMECQKARRPAEYALRRARRAGLIAASIILLGAPLMNPARAQGYNSLPPVVVYSSPYAAPPPPVYYGPNPFEIAGAIVSLPFTILGGIAGAIAQPGGPSCVLPDGNLIPCMQTALPQRQSYYQAAPQPYYQPAPRRRAIIGLRLTGIRRRRICRRIRREPD